MISPRPRRIVLLQVREHMAAVRQEQQCFLRRAHLKTEELRSISLVKHPHLTHDQMRGADAVFIGGAGEYSAGDHYPFTDSLSEVLLRLIEEGVPILGSCWGHQFLGTLLGGDLVRYDGRTELGTYDVEVTPAGERDPLFGPLAPTFTAQEGHHDQLSRPPTGVEVLARSPLCPVQAFRVADKPVYGTQFHAEMDHDDMHERLNMYRHIYAAEPGAYEVVARSLRPSPKADQLVVRFVELFC